MTRSLADYGNAVRAAVDAFEFVCIEADIPTLGADESYDDIAVMHRISFRGFPDLDLPAFFGVFQDNDTFNGTDILPFDEVDVVRFPMQI